MKLMAMELVEAAYFTIHGMTQPCRREGLQRLRKLVRTKKTNHLNGRAL